MSSVPATVFGTGRGIVTSYDDRVGTGTLSDAVDGREWWFHCTRIADGSRTVTVGGPVTYRLRPGPTGLEAVDVSVTG